MDNNERPDASTVPNPFMALAVSPTGPNPNKSLRTNTRRGPFAETHSLNSSTRPPVTEASRKDYKPAGRSQQRTTSILGSVSSADAPTDSDTQGSSLDPLAKTTSESTLISDGGLSPSTKLAQQRPARYEPPKNRRAQFNSRLTEHSSDEPLVASKPPERRQATASQKGDLVSTLTHALSTPPFPDCLICFSSIHPAQPTWSCSPIIPLVSLVDDRDEDRFTNKDQSNSYCWTTFHIRCIRSWAAKNVKDVSDAWRARGEEKNGEWRCPGCQGRRETVPSGYRCFCGAMPEPKLTRSATPHSCANICSRSRVCGHPCPLLCHPGPCRPCQIKIEMRCHCGRRPLSFKCFNLSRPKDESGPAGGTELSCGAICGKNLGCGTHKCGQPCHPGDCEPCRVVDVAKCYCGRVDRELRCGEGESKVCTLDEETKQKWVGRFSCDNVCARPFDCAVHSCPKPCHPPSPTPPLCPRSPSLVTRCPCGKQGLSSPDVSAFLPDTLLLRKKCSDPIPTCNSTCMKPLAQCSHVCSAKCHTGPCPPCTIMFVRPCRCGATTKSVSCSSLLADMPDEILCDKPCTALRACGRHQCNRLCCPLASLASVAKGKGKKRSGVLDMSGIGQTSLHECDLVCGKVLSCGSHRCEERDHRGFCPPCLRSSFEEMICHCGRTVVDPPIPCGTQVHCKFPCTRPPLPCGHPLTHHSCHEDPSLCPPCPFLTGKTCACGKKVVENVRCSQERVSCGIVCGKLLACGFHHCEKLCHSGGCGPCSSPCGKPLKHCQPALHPCTLPCHAPSTCPELEPCRAIVTLTCPCGRIRQLLPCGRSIANPSGRESTQQLKCSNECTVAKRNAKLAEALGINTENRQGSAVVYNDEMIAFARANPKLLGLVEKAFVDFVNSEKRTQVLPQMPPDRRKFVTDLATIYRMDTQTVDQEPHRSVQIFRRIDTRVPGPLLSHVVSSSPPPASLGKLADLRSPNAKPIARRPQSPSPTVAKAPASGPVSGSKTPRGWTAVVARSSPGVPTPAVSSSPSASPGPSSSNSGNVSRSRTQPANFAGHLPIAMAEIVPDSWEEDDEEIKTTC